MLSDFVEKIVSLSGIKTIEISGRTYSRERLILSKPPQDMPFEPLFFNTLESMILYIKSTIDENLLESKSNMFLHVAGPKTVYLCGSIKPSCENFRFTYAKAIDNTNEYLFGNKNWLDVEMFVISLQSMFVQTPQTDAVISMLGNLANENIRERKDEGFTQSIQIRTGIISKSEVEIQNPVVLQPYRTFREVDQPTLNCILRFRENSHKTGIDCALFEADGGQWMLNSMENIRQYLRKNLPEIVVI